MDYQTHPEEHMNSHVGAIAEAFFLANLLFIGVFYIALWLFYFSHYKSASRVSKNHFKQALVTSTLTTTIAAALAIIAFMTSGFASVQALIMAEIYLMVIVPLFMVIGIIGFTKAINHHDFKYPLIGDTLIMES